MALRPFNSVAGISVGENPETAVILANGDITTTNLTATGVSDLGAVGNVKITGGTPGQAITTDGNGNLTFSKLSSNSVAPMPYYIPAGESYNVPVNFQGLFARPIQIEGTLQVDGDLIDVGRWIANVTNGDVLFANANIPTSNAGFTFDSTSGNLSVPGSGLFTGNLLPSANVTYDLGSPTQSWKDLYLSNNTIYIGNSQISGATGNITLTNADGGAFVVAGNTTVSTLENGNSNISINANANIAISVNGTSNVAVFSSNILNVTGNVIASGIKTDNLYYANGSPWDLQQPAGSTTQLQFNNNNDFGASANLTFNSSTNLLTVTGNISANNANLGNTATANYLYATSLTLDNDGVIAVSGTSAGIFASTIDSINFGLGANIVMGSPTGKVTVQGNLQSNGSVSGTALTGTTLTGSLTTAAQPNVTSVGTLTNLSVTGNINTGNITVTNTVDAVNVKVTDLFSKRSSINISTNTVIDTFPISSFRSAKYTMRAGDGVDYQALEVLLVHNDINSIITVYGSLSTSGTDLVLFTTDISAGNVNVYATAVGPSTDLNLMGTYVPD